MLPLCAAPGASHAAPATLSPEACAALTASIPADAIGLPSGRADVDSATFLTGSPLVIAERAPTPASRITPAAPAYCKILAKSSRSTPRAADPV